MIAVRVRPHRPSWPGLRPTLPVVLAAAIGLIVGLGSGAAVIGVPKIQAPTDCTVALNLADKAFIDYENVTTVIHLRATRGQSEFAVHEAELNRLWREIDGARPVYDAKKKSCLGEP